MQEEEPNKWELDSLTTRPGRFLAPLRANLPADLAFRRAFSRLSAYPHCRHRYAPPVAIFRPVRPSPRVVNHSSQILPRLQAR